jgi:DNA-binding NarL/FixJ family response regulator
LRFRVLLVAAEDVLRHAALAALSSATGLEVVASDPAPDRVRQAMVSSAPDVVLVWLESTGAEQVAVAQSVCSVVGEVPVVLMAAELRHLAAAAWLLPSVAGYVTTAAGWEEVVRALKAVARGKRGFDQMREVVLVSGFPDAQAKFPVLSQRQVAILRMISDGLTYREIAQRLSVSPSLVARETGRLFRAMRARNRVGLVARAQAVSQGSGEVPPEGKN